jgi:16S rRNA A1518/A1519 N6-dimethyltransferase RsmA/KsgA/DIM1 with predicted DNA glycosylase/AP lyase activity
VDSALVRFTINNEPKVELTRLLKRTVKAIFMARRKNVKNSLLNAGFIEVEKALSNSNIDKMTRGEKLSLTQIQKLAIALEEFN